MRSGKLRVALKMHSAVDVLLCTASILNICLISLDRYWSISKAVEYIRVSERANKERMRDTESFSFLTQ